jgi:hypothetical protein
MRQVTHEAAGECITRASRIVHILQRITGSEEDEVLREQDRAVFAFFTTTSLGPWR